MVTDLHRYQGTSFLSDLIVSLTGSNHSDRSPDEGGRQRLSRVKRCPTVVRAFQSFFTRLMLIIMFPIYVACLTAQ